MSTRSLIVVSKAGVEVAVLYRHSDGYPEGAGRDLLDLAEEWACHADDMEPGEAASGLAFARWCHDRMELGQVNRDFYRAGKRGMDADWTYYVDVGPTSIDVKYQKGDGTDRRSPKADLTREVTG